MRAFFPAFLVALFAGWCGTLGWGALGVASATSSLVLLAAMAFAAPSWRELRDPLALNREGQEGRGWLGILPWGLWGWCLLSAALSPVPRSGRVALALFPAFLLLPRIVARCLASGRDRRVAARVLSLVGIALALWSLADWWILGSPRAGQPLGHHNVLAIWLVTLLPVFVLPVTEDGPWRWVGGLAALLGLTVLVGTRSLAGLAALGVQVVVLLLLSRKKGVPQLALAIAVLLAGAFLGGSRIVRVVQGGDPSLKAREVYWRAGMAGAEARPLVGWGPGSTPWTLAAFLEPIPGVTPRDEGVGELHDLPLSLAYELGLPGLLTSLAVGGLFLRARWRDLGATPGNTDGCAQTLAGIVGLAGAAVAFLGSAALGIAALPVALAVAAGFSLTPTQEISESASKFKLSSLYAFAGLLVLAPVHLAQHGYDQARRAEARGDGAGALRSLERAVSLDGSFALYRWRLALAVSVDPSRGAEAAEQALRAAGDARGVGLFWVSAGVLGDAPRQPWTRQALLRGEGLSPMSALAPFYLAAREAEAGARAESGARALLAEPRLLGACLWEARQPQLEDALAALARWPGVDEGWKEESFAEPEPPGEGSGNPIDWGSRWTKGMPPPFPSFNSIAAPGLYGGLSSLSAPALLGRSPLRLGSSCHLSLGPAMGLGSPARSAWARSAQIVSRLSIFHSACGKTCGNPGGKGPPDAMKRASEHFAQDFVQFL